MNNEGSGEGLELFRGHYRGPLEIEEKHQQEGSEQMDITHFTLPSGLAGNNTESLG